MQLVKLHLEEAIKKLDAKMKTDKINTDRISNLVEDLRKAHTKLVKSMYDI